MFRAHRLAPWFALLSGGSWAFGGAGGCVQASQIYPLNVHATASESHGSVQVERIEGAQRLLVIQLSALPAPEQVAPSMRVFAAWMRDAAGRTVKLGTLRYDRAGRSADLLGRIAVPPASWFTVRITAERDADAGAPSDTLVAERTVTNH